MAFVIELRIYTSPGELTFNKQIFMKPLSTFFMNSELLSDVLSFPKPLPKSSLSVVSFNFRSLYSKSKCWSFSRFRVFRDENRKVHMDVIILVGAIENQNWTFYGNNRHIISLAEVWYTYQLLQKGKLTWRKNYKFWVLWILNKIIFRKPSLTYSVSVITASVLCPQARQAKTSSTLNRRFPLIKVFQWHKDIDKHGEFNQASDFLFQVRKRNVWTIYRCVR